MNHHRLRSCLPIALSFGPSFVPSFVLPLASPALAAPVAAQAPVRPQLLGANADLARLLAAAHAALRQPAPTNGRPFAVRVLACLRCGDLAASAATLARAEPPNAQGSGRAHAAWLAIAHHWHARAAGTSALPPAAWPRLAAVLAATAASPLANDFADAAIEVHALFAAASLAPTATPSGNGLDGPPADHDTEAPLQPTADWWRDRAITRLVELERQTWQPGRGTFSAQRTDGAIVPPAAGDVATLRPAAAGLLLATGDRLQHHLAGVLADVLAANGSGGSLSVEAAALCLCTATQLADDAARVRALAALHAAADGRVADDDAGLVLDAVLFAITGARLAIGAGVDEAWQRFAPWLPPGHERLAVHDLVVGGARYDLTLEARSGPRRADEGDATAHPAGDAPRLCVQLRLRRSFDGQPRTVVIAGRDVQTVHWLQPGETFRASLLRTQADAQHDAHGVGAGPRCLGSTPATTSGAGRR